MHISKLMVQLGPVYVKIGQKMATFHPSLHPLKKLQEQVVTSDKAIFMHTQQRADGTGMSDVLNRLRLSHGISLLDPTPISIASIGVVFLAKYPNVDCQVVLKLKNQDVLTNLTTDFFWIRCIARVVSLFVGGSHRITDLCEQCIANFESELDFGRELANWRHYSEQFGSNPSVVIPKMFEECCDDDVIVMEHISGIPVFSVPAEHKEGCGRLLYNHFRDGVLTHRVMHADLHAGNIRFLESDTSKGPLRLLVYDFGFVERFDPMWDGLSRIDQLFLETRPHEVSHFLNVFFEMPSNEEARRLLAYDFRSICATNSKIDMLCMSRFATKHRLAMSPRFLNFQLGYFAMTSTLCALDSIHVLIPTSS